MRRRSILARLNRDERGIATAIVAVSLVGLFSAAMLSLDAGNMWQTRRTIITATDSTALEQARFLALSSPSTAGCQFTWTDFMLRNGGAGTTPITCAVNRTAGNTGWVGVDGRKTSETRFGGMFGIGNTHPYSFSAAQWGFLSENEGLRPMGICSENHHFQEWVAVQNGGMSPGAYDLLRGDPIGEHPIYPGAGVVHRIIFSKENPDDCGSEAPGNWGWIDYDCNGDGVNEQCGNPNNTLVDWIRHGYQEPAGIRDCDADADSGGESGDYCNGETGSSGGSVIAALDDLLNRQTRFTIPIFDDVNLEGGNNVFFNIRYFVGVILRGFRVTGPQADRYFDFEFVRLIGSGNCCVTNPTPGEDTGVRGVTLCSMDHDSQAEATRCAPD